MRSIETSTVVVFWTPGMGAPFPPPPLSLSPPSPPSAWISCLLYTSPPLSSSCAAVLAALLPLHTHPQSWFFFFFCCELTYMVILWVKKSYISSKRMTNWRLKQKLLLHCCWMWIIGEIMRGPLSSFSLFKHWCIMKICSLWETVRTWFFFIWLPITVWEKCLSSANLIVFCSDWFILRKFLTKYLIFLSSFGVLLHKNY